MWAIDLADGSASLVIALLLQHGQRVVYLPGIAVNRATAGYRGEGKTDAKDAAIIADQARMRRDLRELHVLDEDIAAASAAALLIVPIWPPTAPAASTGSAASSSASFLPWNECWTSPTAAR